MQEYFPPPPTPQPSPPPRPFEPGLPYTRAEVFSGRSTAEISRLIQVHLTLVVLRYLVMAGLCFFYFLPFWAVVTTLVWTLFTLPGNYRLGEIDRLRQELRNVGMQLT